MDMWIWGRVSGTGSRALREADAAVASMIVSSIADIAPEGGGATAAVSRVVIAVCLVIAWVVVTPSAAADAADDAPEDTRMLGGARGLDLSLGHGSDAIQKLFALIPVPWILDPCVGLQMEVVGA
jgi:hypothetical protein